MTINKDYVLFHLQEGYEELARTISEIATESDYAQEELTVAMAHLFHHLNTAWNARNVSTERAAVCSETDFERWRQFPNDLEIS